MAAFMILYKHCFKDKEYKKVVADTNICKNLQTADKIRDFGKTDESWTQMRHYDITRFTLFDERWQSRIFMI